VVRVGTQPLDIAHLDRLPPLDRAGHARHRNRPARTAHGDAGVVDIDAIERGSEMVGIALAALLAVGDDIDAGPLLIANGEQGGVVLGDLQLVGCDKPEIAHPHARHLLRQPCPIDEPLGLRIGADQTGW
jgi:hypothetical protein